MSILIKINMKNFNIVFISFVIAGLYEGYFAIPFAGWVSYLSSFGLFFAIGLILHVIAYNLAKDSGLSVSGPIVGAIASVLGWVPIFGQILHAVSFVLYVLAVMKNKDKFFDQSEHEVGSRDNGGEDDDLSKEDILKSRMGYKERDEDDLTKIEGIGSKTQEVLKLHGIATYEDLSLKLPNDLKAILTQNHLAALDPTTWPEQAILARDGRWEDLKKWQDVLIGGRL